MCSQRADKLTASVGIYHGSLVYEVQVLNALRILKKSSDHSGVHASTEELCHTCVLFFLIHRDINDLKHYKALLLVMVIFGKWGLCKQDYQSTENLEPVLKFRLCNDCL